MICGAIGPSWLRSECSYVLTALWLAVRSMQALALTACLCGVAAGLYLYVVVTLVISTLVLFGGGLSTALSTPVRRAS
jgi:hypothetical protein